MEMAKKRKIIRKLKCRTDAYCQEIVDKDISLKKLEDHIKTIWNLLLVLGNELEKVGKLAANEKNLLQNEYKKLCIMGIAQKKGEPDAFGILKGLPASSLEIFNTSESFELQNFTPGTINPPAEKTKSQTGEASSYPKESSSLVSEDRQKLLLNVENSSPEQLTDTSASNSFTSYSPNDVDQSEEYNFMYSSMPHDKDEESLQKTSDIVDDIKQSCTENLENLRNTSNKGESDVELSMQFAKDNDNDFMPQRVDLVDASNRSNTNDQEVCVSQSFQPTKITKLSKSLSLTSPQKNSSVDPNFEPMTFSSDTENGTSPKISVNHHLNKDCSKEEMTESLTPFQQTLPRKRSIGKIYTFHINDPKSKRRKSAFVTGVSSDSSQSSQWNNKFNKINKQMKNYSDLRIGNADSIEPCKSKENLKHSVVNMTEKFDNNEESVQIDKPEFEGDNNSETQKEAYTSNDAQSKIANICGSNSKIKNSLDKNHDMSSSSNKKVIVGNYITYIKSENVDLNKSNQSNLNGSNLTVNKKKRKRPCASQDQIKEFFLNFNKIEFSHLTFKPAVQMLVKRLKSPRFFSSTSELLFHVLTYLFNSKKNPLLSFSINEDSAVQIPLEENCIVTALFTIESKHMAHLEGVLGHAMTTVHHLILSKKKFSMFSLGSLCRVLVEICKRQKNSLKPLLLCADLLKIRHPFAAYLIASIAVVWKELFKIDLDLPAEEIMFHSSILYGACNSSKSLTCNRDVSLKIISSYFTAPIVKNVKSAIPNLKKLIEMRCQDNSWNSQYLTSALVILALQEEWNWIQDNLLVNFIIPNLNKFGRETLNEHAFDIFCNLYVDVLLLKPGNPLDFTLSKFVNNSEAIEGENFVKDCAALALMRFMYLKNRQLPTFLNSWFQDNKQNPKVQQIESLFSKKKIWEDLKSLKLEDIL